jgi:hypothetical protein
MVPVLVALTDRVPVRRVYLLGTGVTAVSHLGFALAPPAAAGLLTPADAILVARRQVVQVLAIFEPELQPGLNRRGADQRPIDRRGE